MPSIVCTNEKIFWYSFVMDVLLTWKQVLKIINCVTLHFKEYWNVQWKLCGKVSEEILLDKCSMSKNDSLNLHTHTVIHKYANGFK